VGRGGGRYRGWMERKRERKRERGEQEVAKDSRAT